MVADKRPQAKQSSRKNKSSWRKNIDLTDVEASLENKRVAERVGLAPVDADTAASSLFVEDRKGDEEQRKLLQKHKAGKKPLKSLSVLQSTSTIAPVQTRARKGVERELGSQRNHSDGDGGLTPEQRARRNGIKAKDIEKLRRAAGRDVRGAFGAIVDEENKATKRGPQAAIGGSYDVWTTTDEMNSAGNEWTEEAQKKDVQLPRTVVQGRKRKVELFAPQQGQSYNPAAEAYEKLLEKALHDAQTAEERLQKEKEFKKKWEQGAISAKQSEIGSQIDGQHILGMALAEYQQDNDDASSANESENETVTPKAAKRKTKQQRARAQRRKQEEQAQKAAKAAKAARHQLSLVRSLKDSLTEKELAHAQQVEKRRLDREKKLAERGTGARKIEKKEEDVQLGEDLSESLREIKPQGNLFKDRMHALQKQGYLESRAPSTAASGKRGKRESRNRKEYELHSYKRFE